MRYNPFGAWPEHVQLRVSGRRRSVGTDRSRANSWLNVEAVEPYRTFIGASPIQRQPYSDVDRLIPRPKRNNPNPTR